ncbi:MAG: transporter [Bdellovibrionota bacterium]
MKRENPKQNSRQNNSNQLDLDQYLLIPIFLILLIIATTEARATETSATQMSKAKIEDIAPAASAKKLALTLTLEHASDLKSKANPDRDESTSLIIQPKYNMSETAFLEGRIDLVQNYDSEKRTGVTNSVIILSPTKIDLSKEIAFMPEVSVSLPTDEKIRDDESYQGSVTLRPSVLYSSEAVKGLAILNRVYINKNFHQYELKRDFSANAEYSIRNRFAVVYNFTEKFALELVNDYTRSWTYNGYSKDAFYLAQALGYEFAKDWNVSVSHKNEGSARGPNNNGENIELFAQKSSYLSLGLAHVF